MHPSGWSVHFHCKASITKIHLQRLSPSTAAKGLTSYRVNWKPDYAGERHEVVETNGSFATSSFLPEHWKWKEDERHFVSTRDYKASQKSHGKARA